MVASSPARRDRGDRVRLRRGPAPAAGAGDRAELLRAPHRLHRRLPRALGRQRVRRSRDTPRRQHAYYAPHALVRRRRVAMALRMAPSRCHRLRGRRGGAGRRDGPVVVLSRHAGRGDTLLVLHQLLCAHGRRPRVVMNECCARPAHRRLRPPPAQPLRRPARRRHEVEIAAMAQDARRRRRGADLPRGRQLLARAPAAGHRAPARRPATTRRPRGRARWTTFSRRGRAGRSPRWRPPRTPTSSSSAHVGVPFGARRAVALPRSPPARRSAALARAGW